MGQQKEIISEEKQEQYDQLLESFRAMSEENADKLLRHAERVSKIPAGYPITPELLTLMFDTDSDILLAPTEY